MAGARPSDAERAARKHANRLASARRALDAGRPEHVPPDLRAELGLTPEDPATAASTRRAAEARTAVATKAATQAEREAAQREHDAATRAAAVAHLAAAGAPLVPSRFPRLAPLSHDDVRKALDPATPTQLPPTAAALAVLAALTNDDGTLWGERATALQWDDAAAVLTTASDDPAAPRMHYLTRPRGGSKSSDLAAVALAALLTQAPPRARLFAYARDEEQAGILLDALTGYVTRTPALAPALTLGASAATVTATGARLTVQSADAASAYGRLPWLVIVDEHAQWPTTRAAAALWEAIVSGLPKVPGSRLVTMTSAGDPAHPAHRVIARARTSPRWRVSEMPGPVPWHDPDDLAEQRAALLPSAYARLHENRWQSGEDALVSPEDLAACVRTGSAAPLPHDPARRYVVTVDVGLTNDRTVIAACHAEPSDPATPTGAPPRVVLDAMVTLQGTRRAPVALSDVERHAADLARRYRAPVIADPYQFHGSAERLRRSGVIVRTFAFTATSVGRLASALFRTLRDRRMSLPDDPYLLAELASVRLVTNSAGTVRLDHLSGQHDDRAVALALAVHSLTERDMTPGPPPSNPARSGRTVPTAGNRPAGWGQGHRSGLSDEDRARRRGLVAYARAMGRR